MAVAKTLPGIVVTDTVTKYIEAHSGCYFKIRIDIGANTRFHGDSISFLVHVDGNETEFPFVRRTPGSATIECEGTLLPGNRLRKYKFENLQLVEDALNDGDACRKERFAELGTIRIEAYHDRVIGRTGFINDDASYGNLGPVSEKDVKGQAISQSIGFGPAKKVQFEPRMYRSERLDPSGKPTAVYIFKYRSQNGLRAEHIIASGPSKPSNKREPGIKTEPDIKREPDTGNENRKDGNSSWFSALAHRGRNFQANIERGENEGSPRRRRASRPSGDITYIDLDDDGNVIAERSVPRPRPGPEIELED